MQYIIPLDPRTKKNHQMIAGSGPRCPGCGRAEKLYIRQGKAHDEYAAKAAWYLKPRPQKPLTGPVNVKCLFYMQTKRRVDSLNLMATVDDLLVSCGVLADDNSAVIVSHDGTRVAHDPKNPRTEIYITEAKP